jgi:hypothetical protein
MAAGVGGWNPGRSVSAEARPEVEVRSSGRRESEAAARQRTADGSAAQSGDRDRCPKKTQMPAWAPPAMKKCVALTSPLPHEDLKGLEACGRRQHWTNP